MRTSLPLTLGLLALGIAQAQAQDDDIYELITTAIHTRSSETALPVTVLTDSTLHEAVRATLGDTLASQPGINNASFGPAVGQTVIRGQQGRRVMNLANGLPIADASGNSADHAQTVEAILATSIEVLRGPATLLYGGGAIGGVVNVIDRRIAPRLPDAPSVAFETRHDGASNLDTTVGSLDFATGNLVWHLDGQYREWNDQRIPGFAIDPRYLAEEAAEHAGHDHPEDEAPTNTYGHIANTGGRASSGAGGVSWIFDQGGHIGLAYSHLENRYGLPPGVHGHEHEDDGHDHDHDHEDGHDEAELVHIDMQRDRYDLDGEWHDLAPWAQTLSYKLSYTDYAHSEIEPDGQVGTRFANTSWQHRLQLTHTDTDRRHGALGLQHSDEEFAALGEESFIPVTDIHSNGVFMVEDFHTQLATLEFGARLNRDQYRPHADVAPAASFNTYSLSGSALWDLTSHATLGLSVSRSQRAPSVEELYSNDGLTELDDCVIHFASGACEVGDRRLDKETSLNTDLTLSLDYERVNATVTAFYNNFDDYIAQVAIGEEAAGFPVRAYVQDDARFVGLETDANVTLGGGYSLRLFGDMVRGRLDANGDVPRMPAARVGTELRYEGERWNLYGTVLHAFDQQRAGRFERGTDSWTRLDLGADYTLDFGTAGELMLFVKGRNLGDREIRLPTSYLRDFAPEAGRSLEAGLRYRF
ncbi:MAG TPA: TonB-dependent receptor [Hyphomicrobiales bacterium]|nr:TonB-dependent receptor [Hyphomicrobiales bacterium]